MVFICRSISCIRRLGVSTPKMNYRCSVSYSTSPADLSSWLQPTAYIDGKWIKPSEGTFDVNNPYNNEILAKAANCGEKETDSAIKAANKSFEMWSTTPAKMRGAYLRKMFDLQMNYKEELATLITREMGKPLAESRGEIAYGASFLEWFSEQARRFKGEVLQSPFADKMVMYTKEPAGPVAIITPWNFPNAMITRKLGAALAAGCTVVIRPAEDSPFSGLAIARIAEEAGIPPGVVNVIPSNRTAAPVIGKMVCESPDISVVTFTGSTAVGKQLLSWGASTVKRICLELGGNAPFIVFDSADAEKAAEGCIASKFRNTGQTCVCANRIFVQKGIHDEFVAKLATAISKNLRVGPPEQAGITVGPLVNERAVAKVKCHIEDALAKGGRLLVGGKQIDSNFYEPTLITGIKPDMLLCNEETFGPVAGIISFESEEEVIALANASRVGLAGYFYSREHSQIWRVARKLQVGMIGINDGIISCCEAPFGGVKESGLGREGSEMGMDEFLSVKYLCLSIK